MFSPSDSGPEGVSNLTKTVEAKSWHHNKTQQDFVGHLGGSRYSGFGDRTNVHLNESLSLLSFLWNIYWVLTLDCNFVSLTRRGTPFCNVFLKSLPRPASGSIPMTRLCFQRLLLERIWWTKNKQNNMKCDWLTSNVHRHPYSDNRHHHRIRNLWVRIFCRGIVCSTAPSRARYSWWNPRIYCTYLKIHNKHQVSKVSVMVSDRVYILETRSGLWRSLIFCELWLRSEQKELGLLMSIFLLHFPCLSNFPEIFFDHDFRC